MNEFDQHPQISSLLDEAIAAGDFPSAVYAVAEEGRVRFADARGFAVHDESGKIQPQSATLETIYDLASLTKPLVAGLLCARRAEGGQLDFDAPVAAYLSEFARADKRSLTVRQLLTHTSGLPAWRPLYITTNGKREETLASIAAEPLEYEPGARVVYTDLGFITLGFLLEKITGAQLSEIAQDEIFQPLELQRTFFNPDEAFLTGIAASESKGNAYEREMCGESWGAGEYKRWRESLIWGEVHDGNAHFLGGAAGHAGLFSTAGETLKVAKQFISAQTSLLLPATCVLFRQNLTPDLNEARSLAWQLAATEGSTAGDDLPPDAFGHTGFAGTSCWIDPERERIFILLTNRTHNRALPFANINAARRRFHSLAARALDELADSTTANARREAT